MNILRAFICKSKIANNPDVHQWVNKQTVVYPYKEYYLVINRNDYLYTRQHQFISKYLC